MAINLTAEKYGEQFNAFVNFAAKNTNPNNVARVGKTKPGTDLVGLDGDPRTITAKNWDGSGQFWRLGGSRKVNNEVRDLFLKTILSVCSADTIEQLPQSVQDVLKAEDFNGKGRPLTARRIKAVTDAVISTAGLTEAAGTVAFGTSPAVGKIRNLILTAPCTTPDADPVKKVAQFSAKLSENVSKEITLTIPHLMCKQFVAGGKENFNKNHEQFIKDLERDMKVTVEGPKSGVNEVDGDGQVEEPVVIDADDPKDFETVRDNIVRFITGDRNDTYADVSESVKKKACLLMSFTTQYTATPVMTALLNINPAAQLSTMESSGLCKAGTGLSFSLDKSKNGDVHILLEQKIGIMGVTVGATPYFLDYDRSCCHIGVQIDITGDSLEKAANGDWSKLDYATFHEEGLKCNTDRQLELIPDDLRLDTKVSATVHFEVYTAKPHQDPTNPAYVPPQMQAQA